MLVEGKVQVKASIILTVGIEYGRVGMVQSRLNWTKTDSTNNPEVKKERMCVISYSKSSTIA